MMEVFWLIVLSTTLVGVLFFLYNQGYMVFKSISAVAFIGSAKGNSAVFTACSGYLKRVIKFKADDTCTFVLDAELNNGDMSVELLDSAGQRIMLLNCSDQTASVTVEKKKKYYLVVNFRSATGRYSVIRK